MLVDAYLERNVFAAQPDLQLLPAILVLLWPLGVIFPAAMLDGVLSIIIIHLQRTS